MLPVGIAACLFDLDGVLTDTASVHRRAWKKMFDEYLQEHAQRPFDMDADYLTYVDGKKREDGVRAFLASRDIEVPEETVHALGDRKNDLFHRTMRDDGVKVFEGSRRYLKATADAGLGRAVVSSSANTREVLEITGLSEFVQHRVDGVTMREEDIAGKPAPDSFLRAAELLGVKPNDAAVFEDALSGVAAGRAGKFGVVIGVDRVGQSEALLRNGADVVVTDLAELLST